MKYSPRKAMQNNFDSDVEAGGGGEERSLNLRNKLSMNKVHKMLIPHRQ